jgi:cholest-4-en-3-one 26-monooxygenase
VRISDIDVVSSDVYERGVPYEQFAFLREHAPVFRQAIAHPGLVDEAWVVSRYEDVRTVSLDTDHFSSAEGTTLRVPRSTNAPPGSFISMDDPEHFRLRSIVSKAFTPRVVRTFELHFRELTVRVIEQALSQDRFDFVTAVAAELPLLAICELLGVPEADRHKIFDWTNTLLGAEDPDYGGTPETAMQAFANLGAYTAGLVDQRRSHPTDDVLSLLANARGDDLLSDIELQGFSILLAAAGSETTRNNISHGLLALMDHRDQLEALRAAPDRHLATAVEEITRFGSPVHSMARTVIADTELRGEALRAGELIVMFYGSANRDADVFLRPDDFDIERHPNPHLGFGIGKHFCLGASLARIETLVMFSEILPRADFRLAGPLRRLQSSFIHGIKELPVEVTRLS